MASVEELAVDYFREVLQCYDVNSAHYRMLHGHLGQATAQVRNFVKKNYALDDFSDFFEEHDTFFISHEGYVSLVCDVESAAVDFFEEFFDTNTLGVVHYSYLENYIEDDDNFITEYIFDIYPDEDLLSFFEQNDDVFSTVNGYITLLSERDLASEEKEALEYFSAVVENSSGEFHYSQLRENIEADYENVIDFIEDCYPDDDSFYDFITKNDDVFFVDKDGLVFLKEYVDDDAAEYFKDVFFHKVYGSIHRSSLYGHVGQAPAHVMQYINNYFGRRGFSKFLEMHDVLFRVSEDGYVSYIGDQAAKYFADILTKYDTCPHYLNFRGHVGQAPDYIINFINERYPGEEFHDFLMEYDVFTVTDGYVSLTKK